MRRFVGTLAPILCALLAWVLPAHAQEHSHRRTPPAEAGATASPASTATREAAARTPVLLVPGWGDGPSQLLDLHTRFVLSGWNEGTVRMMAFRDPVGSNLEHAEELARAIEDLRTATGAERVDVVAHSMGGLATRQYLSAKRHGPPVRRVVFLATPHRGTLMAHLAWGEGGEEMVPESPFLERLNASPPVPPGVRVMTIRTPVDLQVLPTANATLPGADNVEICCPTHSGLLEDRETFIRIRSFLEAPEDPS